MHKLLRVPPVTHSLWALTLGFSPTFWASFSRPCNNEEFPSSYIVLVILLALFPSSITNLPREENVLFNLPWLEEGNQGTERLSNLSKIAQLVWGQVRLGIQTVRLHSPYFWQLHRTACSHRSTRRPACSLEALAPDSPWLACQRSPSVPRVTVRLCGSHVVSLLVGVARGNAWRWSRGPRDSPVTAPSCGGRDMGHGGAQMAPRVTLTQPASVLAAGTPAQGPVLMSGSVVL